MARLTGRDKVRKPGVCAGKVPQMLQMDQTEGGAACLGMVCAYYGKWLTLETVRRDCGVGRNGATPDNVCRAARGYGFDAQLRPFAAGELREAAVFPCIVQWKGDRFAVLRGFRGGKVFLNDPAKGPCVYSRDDFERTYAGTCICLTPGDGFAAEGSRPSILPFMGPYVRQARAAILFTALTALITAVVGLMNPALSQAFITRLLEQHNQAWLVPFICVLSGVSVVQIISASLSAVYLLRLIGKLDVTSASGFLWKALHLPLDFYAQRSVSDISARLETTAGMSRNLVQLLSPIPVNALMLLVYLVIMVCYSPMLALVGVAAIGINLAVNRAAAEKRLSISRARARDGANLTTATMAGIQTIETIKASGAEEGFFRKWGDHQAEANLQEIRTKKLTAAVGLVPQIAASTANGIVLVLGILLIMEGRFTTGMLLAFQGYFQQFYGPAAQLADLIETFADVRVDLERVSDVMNAKMDDVYTEAAASDPAAEGMLSGRIAFRDVSFGYTRQAPPVISHISFDIPAGKSVALVGGSGSGKSTIAALLSRLYRPWEGEILLDGIPAASVDRERFCASVAMVCQESMILSDTVANNIRLWDPTFSDEDVIRAARDACIHEDITAFAEGYAHVLSEGGRNLSGGQRQRLELARALVRNPRILILDEATSALDARTEARVMQAVKARGITLVIIAHRLSTVRDCDEILVLRGGRIVEQGTHQQLIAGAGVYAALARDG